MLRIVLVWLVPKSQFFTSTNPSPPILAYGAGPTAGLSIVPSPVVGASAADVVETSRHARSNENSNVNRMFMLFLHWIARAVGTPHSGCAEGRLSTFDK